MSLADAGKQNLRAIQQQMDADGIDALVLTEFESFEQLVFTPILDMPIPRMVVVPQAGLPSLLTPHWGADPVREESWVPDDRVIVFSPYDISASGESRHPSLDDAIEDVLGEISPETIGVDHQHTSLADRQLLDDHVSGTIVDCSNLLAAVYQQKSSAEIELIRESVEVVEAGVEAVFDAVEPGMTEYELASIAERTMTARGARARPYDLHVTSGPHSLQAARRLSHREVEAGDPLIVDFLPKVQHYFCDIARTKIVGAEPTPRQRENQRTVIDALEHVEDRLRPGLAANEVDAMLREFFAEAGHDGQFTHHTGHGVGNDWGPRLVSTDDTTLEEGMVLAVEPGLYEPEVGGVRIEDNFLLTEDGAERLMSIPRDPVEF